VNAPPTERGGYDATHELLADAETATAIFAFNDVCAFGVLDALAERAMQVPVDMSVVGYDNTPAAALRTISLTTVEPFATEIGAEAMRAVLARVKRRDRPARRMIVPPRLIERATTAPPRGVVAIPAADDASK
jgi:DNA-binding LacI/PurR family transcriptional regulator